MAVVPTEFNSKLSNIDSVDVDPIETREWLDAMNGVIHAEGT